jgi:hypothetical protein
MEHQVVATIFTIVCIVGGLFVMILASKGEEIKAKLTPKQEAAFEIVPITSEIIEDQIDRVMMGQPDHPAIAARKAQAS